MNPTTKLPETPIQNGTFDGLSEEDWKNLKAILAKATSARAKEDIVAFVVHTLVDPMPEKEMPLFDEDNSLFAYILAPGFREYLRFLEDPERRKRLEAAAREPGIPAEEVRRALRAKYAQT